MGQHESTVFDDCIIINNDLKPRRIHFYKSIETLKSMTIDKIKKPFYPTNFLLNCNYLLMQFIIK
jgi:hypothetical protein